MTPQELKKSILQLAIQGKLVEQRPEEGTAAELYQQIQTKKQQLIKAGKLKKGKPLPEITEEEMPFDIPESWMWVRLGDIVRVITGKTPSTQQRDNFEPKEICFYKPADINKNLCYTHASKEYVSIKGASCTPLLPCNSILVSCIGSIGKCSIISKEGICNQQINAIFPHDHINMKMLLYFLKSEEVKQREIESSSAATISILNKSKFVSLLLPLPPLAEQRRIVAKIEELLPYIDRYEQAWSRLDTLNKRFPDEIQKSILQLAVQGKLVEQRPEEGTAAELYQQIRAKKQQLIKAGKLKKEKTLPEITEEGKPFDIPESWMWVRLDEISYGVDSKYDQSQSKEIKKTGKYPVVGQGAKFIDGYTDLFDQVLDDPPILLFGDHTRNVKFLDFPFAVGADGAKLLKSLLIDAKYCYILLLFCAKTMRNRGYARHFSLLVQLYLPLPPLAEQKRIVAKIEDLLKSCEKLRQVILR